MAAAIGPGRVGFRICPGVTLNSMADADPVETYSTLLRAVDGLGLAYVHIIAIPLPDTDPLDLVHANWHGPVIANNNLALESGSALIASGRAAAVSFGRAFVSNPDLVARMRQGAPIVRLDRSTLYTGQGDDRRGYTDYPTFEESQTVSDL